MRDRLAYWLMEWLPVLWWLGVLAILALIIAVTGYRGTGWYC